MALASTSYTHDTLHPTKRQIRLVTVENRVTLADGSDALYCSLHAFDFENVPTYAALSYAWGPATPSTNITINGQFFTVRQNLFDFLQQMSRTDCASEVRFWIDQICIDQQNMEERCNQVAFMDEIYKKASYTIAWLGAEDGPSLVDQGNFYWWILKKPYWSRLWIVQEICLSPQILLMYGNYSMSWADFESGWRLYNAEDETARKMFWGRRLNQLRDQRLNCQNGSTVIWTLVDIVSLFHDRYQWTQPHDCVYAVLSLVPVSQRIPADYTISMESLCRKLIENAWYHGALSLSTHSFVNRMIKKLPVEELEQLPNEVKEACERTLHKLNDPKNLYSSIVPFR